MNPSSDHFHTDAVVPSSDHCRTDTVAPSGDHYCIDIVVPSSDHFCTETVPPSKTTNVAPPSDHLHTKRTYQRELIGEKNIHQKFGEVMAPVPPSGYAAARETSINLYYH